MGQDSALGAAEAREMSIADALYSEQLEGLSGVLPARRIARNREARWHTDMIRHLPHRKSLHMVKEHLLHRQL